MSWFSRVETDLASHLPNTINELDEERRALWVSMVFITVTHTLQHRQQCRHVRQHTHQSSLRVCNKYSTWRQPEAHTTGCTSHTCMLAMCSKTNDNFLLCGQFVANYFNLTCVASRLYPVFGWFQESITNLVGKHFIHMLLWSVEAVKYFISQICVMKYIEGDWQEALD